MAFPLTPGSDPFSDTLTKDIWTKVAAGVNIAKITNQANADQLLWMTYNLPATADPIDLTVPLFSLSDAENKFEDGVTARDIYVYPVDKDAKILVEA